jgi:hypothetical protein
VSTSLDGATWNQRSSGFSGDLISSLSNLTSIAYGNDIYVAAGADEYTTNPFRHPYTDNAVFVTSQDGITWTVREQDKDVFLNGITYGNGTFVAVGTSGAIYTSTDGVNWTFGNSGTITLSGVIYGNGTFVAVGWEGVILQSDPL